MAKELSQLLSDLSTEAKKVEDAFAAIAEETDARATERREKGREAAAIALASFEQNMASVEDSVAGHWHALQNEIDAEIKTVQAGIAERQHERDGERAKKHAQAAEDRAARTVAFAAAAVQAAGAAVLDAAVARREADAIKCG